MNILDLDYADLEVRVLASEMHDMLDAMSYARARGGKSRLTQMYMQQAYEDLVQQGKAVLVAHKAKLSHVVLDELQQPVKRTGQPLTLDDFHKSPVSVQVGTALAKDMT